MMLVKKRLDGLRLSAKFTVLLLGVLVLAVALSTVVLWQILRRQAENNVTNRGEVALGMVNAVRGYTSDHVRPTVTQLESTTTDFTPVQVPAFSARATFDEFQTNAAYSDFRFKEASLNPQNPNNQADNFEEELLASFGDQPSLKELSGFRTRDGERVFYIARPLTASSESCLDCHGDPANAPKALLTDYGDQNGFGWHVGDLMATQVIYVPAGRVISDAQRSLALLGGIFVGISAAILALINFWLKPTVIRPVEKIAVVADLITQGSLDAPACADQDLGDVAQRGDELGQLARVFQNMCREVYAREERLRQEVHQLRIEIDQVKQQRQVSEITGSDYFQNLQVRAKEIRRKRREQSDDTE
jgi:methyl-accepting chemotaxis protein